MKTEVTIIRAQGLPKKLGCGRETALKIRQSDPTFPRRVKIFGGVEGWRSDEVDEWIRNRPRSERS
jgi:predicted DNA-binding transcriptional regulator AlpA